jgi:catechol 2,3-dioxygenase-like lactoylglutathione lyase family enzyme
MTEKSSTTIPALPCSSLETTLEFWQSLGFRVTYKQRSPNGYAVLRYSDFELHFFEMPIEPEKNFSTCLVIVAEVEILHEALCKCMQRSLGKVPVKGFPRLSRMKPQQTRFTLTDNAGNSVIFIKRGTQDEAAADAYKQPDQSPLQKAIHTAARLRDFKGDDAAAARVLETALKRFANDASPDYVHALTERLELAQALGETARAHALQAQLEALHVGASRT